MRVLKILKTMVGQLDVLETMTSLEFLSFRDFLGNSSGFQSVQQHRASTLSNPVLPDLWEIRTRL